MPTHAQKRNGLPKRFLTDNSNKFKKFLSGCLFNWFRHEVRRCLAQERDEHQRELVALRMAPIDGTLQTWDNFARFRILEDRSVVHVIWMQHHDYSRAMLPSHHTNLLC